jgi:hypothetical protein
MPNNILITPVSAGVGLMSTGIASLVSPSVAAGYGLGWILQECTISLPLLAVGAAAMSLAGWPLWDIVVDQVGLVSREATLGATCAWIAHFIFRTALIRHRVHRLVRIRFQRSVHAMCDVGSTDGDVLQSPACLTAGSSDIYRWSSGRPTTSLPMRMLFI